jgi:CspA family cold shock protein
LLPLRGNLQVNAEFGKAEATSVGRRATERVFNGDQTMPTGTVKFFNTTKGFGFIAPDDGGNDVFVHISALERAGISTLREGDKVSYEVVSERGKLAASNIQME